MSVEDSTVGMRIKQLREKKEYSQEVLAEKIGIKRTRIADWEIGRATPNIQDVIDLSKVLDTSCDMILRGKRPEFLRINHETGLSDRAIEVLKDFEYSDSLNGTGKISLGNLISYLLESKKTGELLKFFCNYQNAYSRLRKRKIDFFDDFEEDKKRREILKTFKEWAEDNGYTYIAPNDVMNFYLRKMADTFVEAIEEKTVETIEKKTKKFVKEKIKAYELAEKLLLKNL